VLFVFQLGQTRIFFSMARDGLLPQVFVRVRPKHRTPHVATIITGLVIYFAYGRRHSALGGS
jgi:APA family basic amino acid/polyamine antiporter